ncbi:unnamed protein product [Larinioides sclopetarius]|uniref:Uncharacterized protein n=1 Tax=Larinioides sclopetarius TaxID=280406 RepID=A0AAV1YX17_9ARAC
MAKESRINVERFAYDLFVYMLCIFKSIPSGSVSRPKSRENFYESPDFSPVLARVYLHQSEYKDNWKRLFESRYRLCGFKKFAQISEFLQSALILHKSKSVKKRPWEVIESLAMVNELILFLHSKNCRLYLNELAHFWSNYFATLKKDLSNDNLLSDLLYPVYLDKKSKITVNFIEECFRTTYTSVQKETVTEKYCSDVSTVNSTPCSNDLNLQEPLETSESENISTTAYLQNPGLGIRPHEELLLEFYGISASGGKSPNKYNMPGLDNEALSVFSKKFSVQSHQEQSKENRGSQSVTSRLEKKRQKIRTAYVNRSGQKIEQIKLVFLNEKL